MNIQTLESVCSKVTSGGTPSRQQSSYWQDGTIPWLKTGDIKKNFIYSVDEFITNEGLDNSSAKLIPVNSIIIAMYGDGNTAGSVAVNKIELATNQACCNFIIDEEKADYRFVYHYLKGSYQNLVNLKSGGSQQNLNAKTLKNFPIWIPKLETQQKIAGILSAYDELIENNKKRIALLETMAEELYKEWFVRFRFPNYENTEFEKGVPIDWNVSKLQTLGTIRTGKTPPTINPEFYNGEFLFYKTPDMHDKYFVFDTEETLTELGLESQKSQIIEPNSIMVTCIGTGGVTAISTKLGCTNQQINSLTLKDESYLEWAYLMMKDLKPQIEAFGATGATMTNLSKTKFSNLKVLIPNNDLILKFHEKIKPVFDLIKQLTLSNANLNEQKNQLLPRLISGKLSVENLDIQQPPTPATNQPTEPNTQG